MSEGNVMQDMAWQRLLSVGCSVESAEEAPQREPAGYESFLTRRDQGSRRSSAVSTSSAAAASAAPPQPARPDTALPQAPPLGPPPACCSAADTMAAPGSTDGLDGAGRGAAGPRIMRGTDKAVFQAQVAAALGKGRAVWL